MTTERRLLLVLGITEYKRAIDHLDALASAGVRVSHEIRTSLKQTLEDLVDSWLPTNTPYNDNLLPTYLIEVAAEVEEHLEEINELLKRKEGT